MTAPQWLSLNVFETALRRYFKDSTIQILGYYTTYAVPTGDNYTTDMYRAMVTYSNKKDGQTKISLIIKCRASHDEVKEGLVKGLMLFERETLMFHKILPALAEIWGKYDIGCQCVYSSNTPNTFLMFEDLSSSGFKMADRQTGLDLEHCLAMLRKLAELHATSAVLFQNHPGALEAFNQGLFRDNKMIEEWLSLAFQTAAKSVSKWPGNEKYGIKLLKLSSEAIDRVLQSSAKGAFSVLNHGDLWVNNMLFSYFADGKVKDIRFVDLQVSVFTSPAIDLHYFLATSPTMEVLDLYLNKMLDFYYDRLVNNLTKLNYKLDVPDKSEFLEDFRKRAFYGLVAAIAILPVVKASKRSDASLEKFMKDDHVGGFRDHCYSNARFKTCMEYLLPHFEKYGVFD